MRHAHRVPTRFSFDDETPQRPFTGSGRWNLEKEPALVGQAIDVTLGETYGSMTGIRLRIASEGVQDGIYIPVSEDSPNRFLFKKTGAHRADSALSLKG